MKPWITPAACERARLLSRVHPDQVVCDLVGISSNTLHHLKRRDFRPASRATRPVPNDWGLVAPGKSAEWLRKHYRTSHVRVRAWLSERPVARPRAGNPAIAIPPDACAVLEHGGVEAAVARFGICAETARKWRLQLGVRSPRDKRAPAATKFGWADRYFVETGAPTGMQ